MQKHNSSQQKGLSEEQVQQYHRDGYIILRGVFSPEEVQRLQDEAARLLNAPFVNEKNLRTRAREMPSGEKKTERIDPVIDVSEPCRAIVNDERITLPLQQIFGEPANLFKDKLIFKTPQMSGYSMHQDYAWWQPQGEESPLPGIHPDKILSVMIAIDAADEENGAIELFPGYHRELLSPVGALRNMNEEEIAKIDFSTGVLGTTSPGDVIIFHSLAPHRSGSNCSNRSRRQLYMTYNAASAGDAYASQQEHYRSYAQKGKSDKEGYFFE